MSIVIAVSAIYALFLCACVAANEKIKSKPGKEIARSIMAGLVGLSAHMNGAPNSKERAYIRRENLKRRIEENKSINP